MTFSISRKTPQCPNGGADTEEFELGETTIDRAMEIITEAVLTYFHYWLAQDVLLGDDDIVIELGGDLYSPRNWDTFFEGSRP